MAASAPTVQVVSLSGQVIQPGMVVQVTGAGFRPGEPVTIRLDGKEISRVVTRAGGAFGTRLSIPESTLPGSRAVTATQPVADSSPTRSARTTVTVHTEWTMWGRTGRGSNSSSDPTFTVANAPALTPVWQKVTPLWSGVIVSDGVAYITRSGYDIHNNLYYGGMLAVDAATGKAIWETGLGDSEASNQPPVLVGGEVFTQNHGGGMTVRDAKTGQIRDYVDGTPGGVTGMGPVLVDGLILLTGGGTAVVDPATRTVLWSNRTDAEVASANGMVFGFSNTGVVARNLRTGELAWTAPPPNDTTSSYSTPIAANGLVYASFSEGQLIAYDQHTGAIAWQTTHGGGYLASSNGRLYTSDTSRTGEPLVAFNALTGNLLWTGPHSNIVMTPAIAGGQLLAGLEVDGQFSLGVFDPATGALIGNLGNLPRFANTSIAIADGRLYYTDGATFRALAP